MKLSPLPRHDIDQWPPPVVIYVRTAPAEFSLRQAIRETWGAAAWGLGIPVLMFTGWSSQPGMNESLSNDTSEHADLIICDFIDHYHMLSLKMRYIFRWHMENCASSAFFFVNSDAIIYPAALRDYVTHKKLTASEKINQIRSNLTATSQTIVKPDIYGECTCSGFCKDLRGPPVWRAVGSKFYLPKHVYEPKRFPHHCIGYATLMSTSATHLIAQSVQKYNETFLREFWVDDVLYSGVLAREWPSIKLHRDTNAFVSSHQVPCSRNCVAQHWALLDAQTLRRLWKTRARI